MELDDLLKPFYSLFKIKKADTK